jgi:hypothetical protein
MKIRLAAWAVAMSSLLSVALVGCDEPANDKVAPAPVAAPKPSPPRQMLPAEAPKPVDAPATPPAETPKPAVDAPKADPAADAPKEETKPADAPK